MQGKTRNILDGDSLDKKFALNQQARFAHKTNGN
jgi:hypothetical protein